MRRLLPWLLLVAGCATTTPSAGAPRPSSTARAASSAEDADRALRDEAKARCVERPGADATADATPAGTAREPTPEEAAVIQRLAQHIGSTRGLALAHPVPVEVHDDARIAFDLTRKMEEEHLEEARLVYGALGLLDAGIDLRAMLGAVLGEQVAGYYDPEAGRLVVREQMMRTLATPGHDDSAELVILHELVHALQDQRLGAGERMEQDLETDVDQAFRALIEGDATVAMFYHHMMTHDGRLPDVESPAAQDFAELEAAPPIVRVELVAPYMLGAELVGTLVNRGGWARVDQAYRTPPRSMEQVIHPQKFLDGEEPDHVRLPALPALTRAGWSPLGDDDTLGELELSVYLALGTPEDSDPGAAEGWGGDRLRVYVDQDCRPAVVWMTTWDDEAEAMQAEHAARRASRAAPSEERDSHLVERLGRALLIVRGLPPALHAEAGRALRQVVRELPRAPRRSGP